MQNISYVLFFFLASTTYFSHSHTVNATFCIFRHFETALLSFFLFTYEELCFNTRTKIEWYLILYFHPFILLYFCLTFFRLPFSWRVTTALVSSFPRFFLIFFQGRAVISLLQCCFLLVLSVNHEMELMESVLSKIM